MKKSTRHLKHTFTEDEKKQIGADLATSTQLKSSLEDDKKAVVAQFASKIASAEFNIKNGAKKLNQGYEFRDIECEVLEDFKEKKVSFKRIDTGEIVDTRDMLPHEMQLDLPLGKDEKEE